MKRVLEILFFSLFALANYSCAQTWHLLDTGLNSAATKMLVQNNKLVVGGSFNNAGGLPCSNIAIFDGTKWDTIPGGGPDGMVNDMCIHNGQLYIVGSFAGINYNPIDIAYTNYNIKMVARHDGAKWFGLGPSASIPYTLYCVKSYNGYLTVGGDIIQIGTLTGVGRIAKWMGSYWDKMQGGVTSGFMPTVFEMGEYNEKLYVGGDMYVVGGVPVSNIATWDGVKWDSIGSGSSGIVDQFLVDTSTNELYVHGAVFEFNGITSDGIVKFNGTSWEAIPKPPTSNGYGKIGLYHGYIFTSSDKYIDTDTSFAYYDGIKWNVMLNAPNKSIHSYCEFNDTLYVGGSFDSIGTQAAGYIAKFYIPQNPNSIKPILERKTKSELFTNVPNPFDEETSIGYTLLKGQKGLIKVFNGSGIVVAEYNLKPSNEKIIFKAGEMIPGMYYYSLYVNGERIQTNKMVLER